MDIGLGSQVTNAIAQSQVGKLTRQLMQRPPVADMVRPHNPPIAERTTRDCLSELHVHFIRAANVAANESQSYRGFDVGASAVISAWHGIRYVIPTGMNIKLGPGKAPRETPFNIHAEDYILHAAKKTPGQILLLVVTGPLQPDNESGIKTPTLHCCDRCRARFIKRRHLFVQDAAIVSIAPDFSVLEMATVEGLDRYHKTKGEDRSGIRIVTGLPKISDAMRSDMFHKDWNRFDRVWEQRRVELFGLYFEIAPGAKPEYLR